MRLLDSRRAWVSALALTASSALLSQGATAQDCPTAQSAKNGFVVERNERQKSEIFYDDQGIVRSVMRYDGKALLETTQFQGLFDLDRLDRGRRTKYEPSIDLKALFPLKSGQQAKAKFISEADGRFGRLYIELTVKNAEDMYIGPCKYSVLRIERGQSNSAEPPRFIYTEFYSTELKFILAREYKNRDGKTELIKYDRIYPAKN